MTALFFVFLFFLCLFLSKHLLGSIYTPFMVYSAAWSMAGFLFGLHWIAYPSVTDSGWIGILIAWLAVLVGSFLGQLIRLKPAKFKYFVSNKRLFRAIIITNFLVIIGLIWKLQILLSIFGSISNVNLTSLRIMIISESFHYPAISSYLTSLSLAGVALAMIYFFNYGLARGTIFIPLILVIVSDWTYAGRAGLFVTVFLIASCFFIYRSIGIKKRIKIPKKSQFIMIVFSIGLLLAFSLYILSSREGNIDQYSRYKSDSAIAYVPELSGIYTYYTSNLVSIGLVLKNQQSVDGGAMLFSPVLSVISKFTGVIPPESYYPFVQIPAAINTYSYLYEFYKGFGWLGIFVGPLILGFLSQRFLVLFKVGKIFATIPLIFLTTVLAFSVSGNLLVRASYDIAFVVAIILLRWATIRSKE